VISIENINKFYGDYQALTDVSLYIPEKCIYGLLGPNGAGKTSLIRIINQITAPDSGRILFDDQPLAPRHVETIGYLPEERGLYRKMKVGEQVLYLAQLKGLDKHEAKRRLKLWFDKFEIGSWWDRKVEDLSKGMQQKVQFIATVIHEPKLLILDEPFSGFDPINAEMIKNEILQLRKDGATIIFSTHNMKSVEEMCDKIALINRSKKIMEGRVETIKNKHKTNHFEIQFEGNMISFSTALWAGYKLIRHEGEKENMTAVVSCVGDQSINDLLAALIPSVKIKSVREVIPSMNDIFIQKVREING